MKRATSPPELLIPLTSRGDAPLRVQVERGLRQAIQTGRLAAGTLLPSTRVLAGDLGVSRGVVIGAYEQLLSEGYLTAQRGSATRVAARRVERGPVPITRPAQAVTYRYDFRPGVPDLSLFPRRAWMMAMRRAVDLAPNGALDYSDGRGAASARHALAAYLNRARATVAESDQVVLCTGIAQGLRLVCRALRDRGVTRIAVEDPGHPEGWYAYIDAEGVERLPIPVDADGLRTDLLARTDAGAVLLTPAHQFPTGAVLSPKRRAAVLDWALARNAVIIEDDYDAEYRYDREPTGSLQGLAPDHVVYMGTASKMLAPALRLGWLVVPSELVDNVVRAKFRDDQGSPAFDQLALAEFLERGELDRHLRRTRLIYRRRRDLMMEAIATHLPDLRPMGVAAGLHLMVELGDAASERQIIEAAARRSIRVFGVGAFRASPTSGPPALLLGFGALSERTIADAVRELASLL